MNGNSIWYGAIALMLAVFLVGLLAPEKKGRKRRSKNEGEHAEAK